MSSGVQRIDGSLGPPTPSVRFVRSWPTKTNVPPGASARRRSLEHEPPLVAPDVEVEDDARGRTRRGSGS